MMNNFSEADCAKHEKRIIEREPWELVETGRENIKNNGVLDGFMDCKSTEYSSHALANAVNQENSNDWILVTIFRNG